MIQHSRQEAHFREVISAQAPKLLFLLDTLPKRNRTRALNILIANNITTTEELTEVVKFGHLNKKGVGINQMGIGVRAAFIKAFYNHAKKIAA